jgi:hypothetical protein
MLSAVVVENKKSRSKPALFQGMEHHLSSVAGSEASGVSFGESSYGPSIISVFRHASRDDGVSLTISRYDLPETMLSLGSLFGTLCLLDFIARPPERDLLRESV